MTCLKGFLCVKSWRDTVFWKLTNIFRRAINKNFCETFINQLFKSNFERFFDWLLNKMFMSHRSLKKGYLSTLESGLLTTPFKNGAGLLLKPLFGAFLCASRYSDVIQPHGTTDGQNPNLIIAKTTYYPLSLPNWYWNALSNR